MELSSEDSLRLNVLLTQRLEAVRIDESRMVVHALSDKGEAKVPLNPSGRDEHYLRQVRQLLSTRVLGSPGGYPVYLRRWTRMGQARDESLEKLLLLGEPEAVVAVVHAPGLTDELARRAWWASPSADNARRMLERACVAEGEMGPVLAEFLLEYLPFEQAPQDMVDSVRLVLKPGLIERAQLEQLWARCKRKNSYYVGFLQAMPDELPLAMPAHPRWQEVRSKLQPLIEADNPLAVQLCRTLSAQGQAFLDTAEKVLRKPVNQDVVVALLEALGDYFSRIRVDAERRRDIQRVLADADRLCSARAAMSEALLPVLNADPELGGHVRAMLVLSMIGEQLVAPVFGLTNAIGSVMRKKIEPITTPLLEQFALLRG